MYVKSIDEYLRNFEALAFLGARSRMNSALLKSVERWNIFKMDEINHKRSVFLHDKVSLIVNES